MPSDSELKNQLYQPHRGAAHNLFAPNQGNLMGSLPVRRDNYSAGQETRSSAANHGGGGGRGRLASQDRDGGVDIPDFNEVMDPGVGRGLGSDLGGSGERNGRNRNQFYGSDDGDGYDDDDRTDDQDYYDEEDPAVLVEQLKQYVQVPDRSETRDALDFLSQKQETLFAVDQLYNMPMFTGSTRVTIYFGIPHGKVVQQISNFIHVVAVQSDESQCLHPQFPSSLVTTAPLTPKAVGVIQVEIMDRRTQKHHVFGHLVVPLYKKKGYFEQRLRAGPVNSDLIRLGGGGEDGRGIGTFKADDYEYRDYLPMVALRYRINEPSNAKEPFIMFDPTPEEKQMVMDRPSDMTTPLDHRLPASTADRIFEDQAYHAPGGPRGEPPDLGSYFYNPNNGFSITVHGLRGLQPLDAHNRKEAWSVLYKVVVDCPNQTPAGPVASGVSGRQGGGAKSSVASVGFTTDHNWDCDVRSPMYNDTVFPVVGAEYNPFLYALLRVVEMRPVVDASEGVTDWDTKVVAFAYIPIFVSDERYVRFSPVIPIQLFQGQPRYETGAELKTCAVNEVVASLIRNGTLKHSSGTISISLCDALRTKEIRQEHFLRLARTAISSRLQQQQQEQQEAVVSKFDEGEPTVVGALARHSEYPLKDAISGAGKFNGGGGLNNLAGNIRPTQVVRIAATATGGTTGGSGNEEAAQRINASANETLKKLVKLEYGDPYSREAGLATLA